MEAVGLVTPLIVLLIIVWFGFVGCGSFGTTPPPTVEQSKPLPYKELVAKTGGLLAYWPLDETQDDTAYVSGLLAPGANGTYTFPGVTLADTSGPLAQKNVAPLFDGSKGYVEIKKYQKDLNPGADKNFSVELWMKPKVGTPGANQVLVSSRQSDGANQRRGYDILLVRGPNLPKPVIRARLFAPNVANETKVDVPLDGDESAWRHVVCTYRGGAGALLSVSVRAIGSAKAITMQNNTNVAYEPVPVNTFLRFGAGHKPDGDPTNFFGGWLDEIAFYNVALHPDEDVKAHFDAAMTP